MNPYIAFTLAAVVTYALRSSMTVAGDRLARSARLKVVTGLVTPAVLASMIASGLVVHHGDVSAPQVIEVVAVAAAFVVARRTGNFGYALAVGMPLYWLGSLVGLT